jgi:hypothetical protein
VHTNHTRCAESCNGCTQRVSGPPSDPEIRHVCGTGGGGPSGEFGAGNSPRAGSNHPPRGVRTEFDRRLARRRPPGSAAATTHVRGGRCKASRWKGRGALPGLVLVLPPLSRGAKNVPAPICPKKRTPLRLRWAPTRPEGAIKPGTARPPDPGGSQVASIKSRGPGITAWALSSDEMAELLAASHVLPRFRPSAPPAPFHGCPKMRAAAVKYGHRGPWRAVWPGRCWLRARCRCAALPVRRQRCERKCTDHRRRHIWKQQG